MRHLTLLATVIALATAGVARVDAQTIASRVAAVRDGSVQMYFAARPDICGDGNGSMWTTRGNRYARAWDRPCVRGPVRVTIGRADGQSISVRTCVVCAARSASARDADLGEVSPVEAAKYLIAFASSVGGTSADEAITGAVFADAGDITAELRGLIRNENATLQARRQALFWISQDDRFSTKDLAALYDDLKPYSLREHFTFVLTQRSNDELAVAKLIDIARHDGDTGIRKQAMFWLGQSRDPQAIKFFKDILSP